MNEIHPHLSDSELLDRLRRFANTLIESAFRGESWSETEIIDLAEQRQLAANVGTEDEPEFEMHPRIVIKMQRGDDD